MIRPPARLRFAAPTLLSATLLSLACSERGAPDGRPSLRGAAAGWNVVFISVDTLRADRLGAYGYRDHPTSPAIDELFASGVGFERAVAQRGATWPSLASVLTGLYPSGHGVIKNGWRFRDETLTLPKILQASGYHTAAFLNNMKEANHQGWDDFKSAGTRDHILTGKALDWLESYVGPRPFFLWIHLFGVHAPYTASRELLEEIARSGYRGPVRRGQGALHQIMKERTPLTGEDVAQLDRYYDAAVQHVDQRVGWLVEALRAAGHAERTLLVFFSDHGEELYDHHGYFFHACSVYESVLQVPLVISSPGLLPAGELAASTVELIDLTPTVLDLLGLPEPPGVHGRSLVPILERPGSPAAKPAFSEYGESRIRTVIRGEWKLIVNPDEELHHCFRGAPIDLFPIQRFELYHLPSDPGEARNLAAENAELVAELAGLIERRFAGLERPAEQQEIPESLRKELEALGYLAN